MSALATTAVASSEPTISSVETETHSEGSGVKQNKRGGRRIQSNDDDDDDDDDDVDSKWENRSGAKTPSSHGSEDLAKGTGQTEQPTKDTVESRVAMYSETVKEWGLTGENGDVLFYGMAMDTEFTKMAIYFDMDYRQTASIDLKVTKVDIDVVKEGADAKKVQNRLILTILAMISYIRQNHSHVCTITFPKGEFESDAFSKKDNVNSLHAFEGEC